MAEGKQVLSFGCRLNIYESEVIKGHLPEGSNTLVVNTCAVTSEAERQARQAIRRAHRENPEAEIVVTGCAAQVNPKAFADMPEVARVVGNQEKLEAATWQATDAQPQRVVVQDIMAVRETAPHLLDGYVEHTRAFVQVQTGCDHRCTFCIIPFGRGNSRSVPVSDVVDQVHRLVEGGAREVVITGVDVTSFGADLPGEPTLGQLIRRILMAVPALPRLRLSSLDAVEMDDDLLALVANEPRLMPHFHLSLQAGDDMILKRMKRRHLRHHAVDLARELRRLRPDCALGADIITGFPTETEDMFRNSLDLVDDCGLTYLHVFPYSEREGTPAAKMPPVAKSERKHRAARLRAKGDLAKSAFLSAQQGEVVPVLFEKDGWGRTPNFASVRRLDGSTPAAGTLESLRLVDLQDGILMGVPH
ncbi:tRNA (N(6)-L-threonylcarbamoyladenosine(37)-C(2))-methylthiotransferase MtaB [Alphaproteobacteria bacterium]|mgnify:FL=1|jgi:threonylcarbamoyladenosine tRNA methylthiotransferase MtaB|nr:tRNA (N(6)-L-threonylcarbamoyladenosine(37)-C(2))-methylthiotransferase MtaB [Alphaproteobacteria bacterium]